MKGRSLYGFMFATFFTLLAGPALGSSISASYAPTSGGISLGTFVAGTYNITASGIISLAGPVGSPTNNFDVDANGVPVTGVTYPAYTYFNPNGASYDGVITNVGPGGALINLGALMGTLVANPTLATQWFLIGTGTSITLYSTETIYAAVNDTYYSNNTGAFTVLVSQVPLPAAAWLFGSALLGLVAVARRRAA